VDTRASVRSVGVPRQPATCRAPVRARAGGGETWSYRRITSHRPRGSRSRVRPPSSLPRGLLRGANPPDVTSPERELPAGRPEPPVCRLDAIALAPACTPPVFLTVVLIHGHGADRAIWTWERDREQREPGQALPSHVPPPFHTEKY